MTMTIESHTIAMDIESIADYEGIRSRFLQDFEAFVQAKKAQAVEKVLQNEIRHETLRNNPDFVQAIINRISDEAVIEKPYIFLSINSKLEDLVSEDA